MSALRNLKTVQMHLEAVNTRAIDRVAAEINTPDAKWVSVPAGVTFSGGAEGYKQFLSVWLTAFPDAKVEVKNVSAGEDFAVAEFIGKGTHQGPLKTAQGALPATQKPFALEFCEVYTLKEGRIASCRLYFDVAGMLRQLGLV